MDSDAVRIGILGATGYIGTAYRRELRNCPGAKIFALAARRESLLQQAKEEDGALLATPHWKDVVDHPQVDFVMVATPDAQHHEQALYCARKNKHLFCEKPIGMNFVQANSIRNAYAKLNKFTFVPFWTRYSPPFVRVKEILASGRLGQIRAAIYRWHNPRPKDSPKTWRDDASVSAGGSLADVGSHAYDMIRWLLEEDAEKVLVHSEITNKAKRSLGDINLMEALQSECSSSGPLEDVTASDYSSIDMVFPSGRFAAAIVSHAPFLRKGICPELELHGTEASLSLNRVTGELLLAADQKPPEKIDTIPDTRCNRFESYVLPALVNYKANCQSEKLTSKAAGKTPNHQLGSHPNLEDGLEVQRFVEAGLASSQTGTWQPLPARPKSS